jgi:hypothetical protein
MWWTEKKSVMNFRQSIVFMIESAGYHNVLSEKCHTPSLREKLWKTRSGSTNCHSAVTWQDRNLWICALHKPRQRKMFVRRFKCARRCDSPFVPHQPDLNAFGNTWVVIIEQIGRSYVTCKLTEMWQLWELQFAETGEVEWAVICHRVQNVTKVWWSRSITVSVFVCVLAQNTSPQRMPVALAARHRETRPVIKLMRRFYSKCQGLCGNERAGQINFRSRNCGRKSESVRFACAHGLVPALPQAITTGRLWMVRVWARYPAISILKHRRSRNVVVLVA